MVGANACAALKRTLLVVRSSSSLFYFIRSFLAMGVQQILQQRYRRSLHANRILLAQHKDAFEWY